MKNMPKYFPLFPPGHNSAGRKAGIFRKSIYIMLLFLISSRLAGQLPASYYDNSGGMRGGTLQQALHDIIEGHAAQSYSSLWTHFETTDKKANGRVWDMYSDTPVGTPPYEYDFVTDQCGNYSGENSCYNREHSFPKSWFNDDPPMNTDLFHLYPTDGYVNGRRSNYPYGEVGSASWTSLNGSKLGPSVTPGYAGKVFEPIDAYKGDFARTYFYMAVRYYGEDGGWPGSDMVDGAQPKAWALEMLRNWDREDPVSEKETARNNAVYGIQGNRNPFIDRPWFSGLIWGNLAPAPVNLRLENDASAPIKLLWDDAADNETAYRVFVNDSLYEELPTNSTESIIQGYNPGDSLYLRLSSVTAEGEVPSAEILAVYPEAVQAPYRFMAYNIENYGEDFPSDHQRNSALRRVLDAADADIILFCEVWDENGGFTVLQDSIFSASDRSYEGQWIDQDPVWQDIGVFYRSNIFRFISHRLINISGSDYLRDAYEAIFEDLEHGNSFRVIGLHLKANSWSDNDENLATRAAQTDALRDYLDSLPENEAVFVLGDLNMLNGSEIGWQNLTGTGSLERGRLYDPPERLGGWNNNAAFADVHSYSAADLDTRFDFILHSAIIEDSSHINYVPDSYRVMGNDANHYGRSVNELPNGDVDPDIADALVQVSDHLPVLAEYSFSFCIPDSNGNETGLTEKNNWPPGPEDFTIIPNYPNPFNGETVFSFSTSRSMDLHFFIYDIRGRIVHERSFHQLQPGEHYFKWYAEAFSSGIYFYRYSSEGKYYSGKTVLLR